MVVSVNNIDKIHFELDQFTCLAKKINKKVFRAKQFEKITRSGGTQTSKTFKGRQIF